MSVFRMATLEDEKIVSKWLQNPLDCKWAIGKDDFSNDDYFKWLGADDQVGYFLEIEDEILAYGEIWIDIESKDVELAHIIVNPEHRGKGYGKQLTDLLFFEAQKYGFPFAYLRIYHDNLRAISCYQSLGFQRFDSVGYPEQWLWLRRQY